jgi:hypothetical protein
VRAKRRRAEQLFYTIATKRDQPGAARDEAGDGEGGAGGAAKGGEGVTGGAAKRLRRWPMTEWVMCWRAGGKDVTSAPNGGCAGDVAAGFGEDGARGAAVDDSEGVWYIVGAGCW